MKRKRFLIVILCALILASPISVKGGDEKAISPSSWAAVDSLGRTLSGNDKVGNKRNNKFVGMFYWIWHYPWANGFEPITTGSVLDKYPEAVNDKNHPAWNNTSEGRPYFWGEPLLGFYNNTDEYVLRKHAELLADADIDVVFFDTTNGDVIFEDGYEALLRVWSEAKEQGVDVPQISFILNFADRDCIRSQLYKLYDNIYSKGRYEDMWFRWYGKPLLMADVAALDINEEKDKEIYDFFTFKDNEATYFCKDTPYYNDTWGWCSDYPQTRFGKRLFGGTEQMCVSVAQNANENGLSAMNNPEGTVQGRAFTDGDFSYSYTYAGKEHIISSDTENAKLYGLNFQQQWDHAIEVDPDFVFVTGFNEWVAGRFYEWCGTENAFPDQFSPAFSRDIEPERGELKDNYYYQLVENVRRFKGADSLQETRAEKKIDIGGSLSQWDDVLPEYNHYEGGKKRDYPGWKETHYKNDTFRNDIVSAKVAYDEDNIYFLVKTKDDLSPSTDPDWMRLLIDTDESGLSPSWEGFEYVINRNSPGDKAVLEKVSAAGAFEEVCGVPYQVDGNSLIISVPRSALELNDDIIKFNFKWSDNLKGDDALSFYENGDCAPGGRFAFRFDSSAKGERESLLSQITRSFNNFKIMLNQLYAKIRQYFIYKSKR